MEDMGSQQFIGEFGHGLAVGQATVYVFPAVGDRDSRSQLVAVAQPKRREVVSCYSSDDD